jgi:hypothetical protein
VLNPGDGTRKVRRQKPTIPYNAIASHTIAAYVSFMVVSTITETVVLLYLYYESIISVYFQAILRCSTCHNLYMPRSFRQPACIPIVSKAATCHNFDILRSFRQHACSCEICSHKPENAACRDAKEKNKQNQARGARRRPALSLCYVSSSKLKEEETSSPARHYTNVSLCKSGNLYKAPQFRSSTNSTLPFEHRTSCIPFKLLF